MFKNINNVGRIICDICKTVIKLPALEDQSLELDLCNHCEFELREYFKKGCPICGSKYIIDKEDRKCYCINNLCRNGK